MWWTIPDFLLNVVEKWPSEEFKICVKEKDTENISGEILVCSVVVEPLLIEIGKMVDLVRFSSMNRLLSV